MKCSACDATVDLTQSACPACGAPVELGRLTGILGVVCRACDAYNEPHARTCAGCGKPLGETSTSLPAAAAAPATPPPPAPAGAAAGPVVRAYSKPGSGPATRVVPAVLRPSAAKPPPDRPAITPIPLVSTCPGCGAEAGSGRFCARCGQPLGPRGTQVVMKPVPPAGRMAAEAAGAAGRAKLVLEAGEGFEGATYRLDADTVAAGRSKGAIVFPDDPCLAAHHATFLHRRGALHVRDEGAPGGVFLRIRAPAPLRPGDHFSVGGRLLRYAGPLPPAPAPPPDGTRRLGCPRPQAPAIVVEEWLEGGAAGRVFVRGGPAVTIGRAGCAVSLGDDPHVSQSHAELAVDAAGNVRLRDLGSSNGTFVKLPPRAERALQEGDRVRLGREVLRVAVS
ncbi:MAG TPA: FHA domain-containing protein [Anaeromyxobacter sp.]|nr:FHA domain-containing protein [Anaeromyxobacter sp.]